MATPLAKKQTEVKVDIRLGPGTTAQKVAWVKVWRRLLAEVRDELTGGKSNAQ